MQPSIAISSTLVTPRISNQDYAGEAPHYYKAAKSNYCSRTSPTTKNYDYDNFEFRPEVNFLNVD